MLETGLSSPALFGKGSDYLISTLTNHDGLVVLALAEREQGSEAICPEEHKIRVVEGKISEHWGTKPLFSDPHP